MIDRQTNKQQSIKSKRDYYILATLQTSCNTTHAVYSSLFSGK